MTTDNGVSRRRRRRQIPIHRRLLSYAVATSGVVGTLSPLFPGKARVSLFYLFYSDPRKNG